MTNDVSLMRHRLMELIDDDALDSEQVDLAKSILAEMSESELQEVWDELRQGEEHLNPQQNAKVLRFPFLRLVKEE